MRPYAAATFRAALLAVPLLGLLAASPPSARAQLDSREAIALQNQILQLRAEMDQLRRGGVAPVPVAPPPSRGPVAGGGASGELLAALLDRVSALEEEVRRMRGRLDEADFRNRQLSQQVEKLQGDMDFRLQQLEAGRGGAAAQAAPARPAPQAATPSPPPVAAPPAGSTAVARPPERAIADGQAALARRDFGAAEAAAREALASRGIGARATDAQMLLADALSGKRDFAGAALAYNEAYSRGRQGPRAPEALVGLANSFNGLGNRREACDTLADLRSNFPNLRPPLADRANEARTRAGCR